MHCAGTAVIAEMHTLSAEFGWLASLTWVSAT